MSHRRACSVVLNLLLLSLVAAPPAVATAPTGGPPALYGAELALPAPAGWPFGEAFPRTSGAGRIAGGALFWSDFLYDDQGATGTGAPKNESPGAPSFGTYRYSDPDAANNGADLFRVAVGADANDTWWRVDWNTLVDPNLPIAAFGIDADGNVSTGSANWPANAALSSPGLERVLVLSAGGAWLHDLTAVPSPTVQDVVVAGGALHVDTTARSFVVRIPRTLFDPTSGTSSLYVAAGIANAQGDAFVQLTPAEGAAPTQPNVYNMAFRDYLDEPPSSWFDDTQAANLQTGDASAFSVELDWSRLLAGDVDPEPVVTGYVNRWYVSSIEPGDGITEQNPAGPHYLGRVQPYMAYVPTTIDPATPAPITFWLHGGSSNHNSQPAQNPNTLQLMCEQRGSICVSPLGRGPLGNYEGVAELDYWEVWRAVANDFVVDPDRTIQAGYSMGGFGSYRYAEAYPDLYAGVVIQASTDVGAPNIHAPDGSLLENLKWTPYYHAHGGADQLVPPAGAIATVQLLDMLDYRYRFDFYPAQDHVAYAIQDHFEDSVQFMTEQGVRKVDPGHIVYRWLPVDVDSLGRFGPTGAWWADEAVARDSAATDARIEVASLANPDPVVVASRTMEARPDAQPSPANRMELTWSLQPPPPAEPRVLADLDNVGSVTLNLDRAGLHSFSSVERFVEVDADGPGDVVLAGLYPGTEVSLDDVFLGSAAGDGRFTVPVPSGVSVIEVPEPAGPAVVILALAALAGLGRRRGEGGQ